MKHLLLGLAILLPTLASADITLKGEFDAIFTGEDAAELKSLINNKSFKGSERRGIQAINCQKNECRIKFHGDTYDKSLIGRDVQRESEELNTFFQSFIPNESEILVSIPSGAWYFHDREEVVESDKVLYKFLSSLKNAEKGELDDDKTVSVEGKNFKLSCLKQKKPKRYEMAKCVPHGGCLPSIFSNFIKITHQCRSYLKVSPK